MPTADEIWRDLAQQMETEEISDLEKKAEEVRELAKKVAGNITENTAQFYAIQEMLPTNPDAQIRTTVEILNAQGGSEMQRMLDNIDGDKDGSKTLEELKQERRDKMRAERDEAQEATDGQVERPDSGEDSPPAG